MKTLPINRSSVNVSALDTELRNTLSEQYVGLSERPGTVKVHLMNSASAAQMQQAEQLVLDHNAAALTAEQEAEQTRQQAITQFRSNDAGELDLTAYDGASAEIQALAQKLAWLELEIRELRGL